MAGDPISPRARRGEVVALALLVLAASVPILAAAARVGSTWIAVSDEAAIVLRSRDVLSPETPLVGMPTTLGLTSGIPVHHPGPMGFWPSGAAQAVVDHAAAPMVATVAVNLLCVAAVVVLAHRLGGWPGATLAAALVALSTWSFHDQVLTDPYNPYAGHLPIAAYAVAVVALVANRGRGWAWPVAVVAGSYAAQSHVSLLAPIAGITLAAVAYQAFVGRAAAATRTRPTAASVRAELVARRPLVVAAFVGAVCWLPVVIDLVLVDHNLWHLAFAAGSDAEAMGLGRAWQLLARAVTSPAWLTEGRQPVDIIAPVSGGRQVAAIVLLGVSVGLAVACRRRRAVSAALVVAVAGLGAGTIALARVPVDFWTLYTLHSYIWLWPLSALLWGGCAAALASIGRDLLVEVPRRGWLVPTIAATSVVAAAGLASLPPSDGPPTRARELQPATTALADGAAAELAPDGTYYLEVPATPLGAMVPLALALELERRGVDVVAPARLADMLGAHRVGDGTAVDGRLVLHQGLAQVPAVPLGTRLATFTPNADDLARLDDARAAVNAVIEAHGGLTVDDGDRTTYTPEEAERLVADGDLVSLWELDMVLEPAVDRRLMVELRAAHHGPVVAFALDLVPTP